MIGRSHVRRRFSDAFDGSLSAAQHRDFDDHLQRCGRCAADYAAFRASLGALHAMPLERMPRTVHIPTAPLRAAAAASETRMPAGVSRLRLAFAGAGALGAVALVVVLLAHGVHPANEAASQAGSGAALAPAARCVATVPIVSSAATNRALAHPSFIADASRPGEELVTGVSSPTVRAGSTVEVYAALSVSSGGQGSLGCVTVTGGAPEPALAQGGVDAPDEALQPGTVAVSVPAGTAVGTVLHITVTIPAGEPHPGDAPIIKELTVTVVQ